LLAVNFTLPQETWVVSRIPQTPKLFPDQPPHYSPKSGNATVLLHNNFGGGQLKFEQNQQDPRCLEHGLPQSGLYRIKKLD
jgi:hypothetical protein